MREDGGLRALTLHRPWTELVLRCGKPVENRPWSTTYRGRLIIHGGKTYDPRAVEVARRVLDRSDGEDLDLSDEACPQGLLGVVTLGHVHHADQCRKVYGSTAVYCSPWAFPGQFHWRLATPRPLREPVPCRGFQRLWRPSADVLARAQL
jgi:hypothetical protein